MGCLGEISGSSFHVAGVEHFDTAVDDNALVGLVHRRAAVGDFLYQRERVLVVAGAEIKGTEYFLHLGFVLTLGVLDQIILERADGLVVGVGVELIGKLGIVKQGILLDLGVVVHLRGLEEHAACLVFAVEFDIHIAQHIEGVLCHAVVAGRLL